MLLVTLIALIGCKSNQKGESPVVAQRSNSARVANPWMILEENIGKYINDTLFFANASVDSTLHTALGKDFQKMKDEWNVPSPLNRAKNVIYITNCKTEKCSQGMWIVMINIARNVANVYHFEPKKITFYQSTQKLVLPPQIESYITNIKRNLRLSNLPEDIITADDANKN
ncbi:MAG: hypothetical protein Q4F97_06265 [Bacteroidales bacterium]|nr:hypothetical protein [Bacteroidales bacterium]